MGSRPRGDHDGHGGFLQHGDCLSGFPVYGPGSGSGSAWGRVGCVLPPAVAGAVGYGAAAHQGSCAGLWHMHSSQ